MSDQEPQRPPDPPWTWDPSGPPPQSSPQGPPPPPPPPAQQWAQPAAGQPQWGAPPPYGYAQPRQTESSAIVALVLAIAAWAVCPLVLAIAALVVANSAEQKIRASGGWLDGEGMVKAAKIIAWINVALGALGLAFFLIALVVAVAAEGSPLVGALR